MFNARNTGLDTPSDYPELSSTWKAAHIKVVIGYMAVKAIEFGSVSGAPEHARLFTCLFVYSHYIVIVLLITKNDFGEYQ